MGDLEVRHVRYFVAVAEELHFGRAAERIGIAQPPLSRAVRDLERRLGVQLLERTTRRVALTPAGEVFLADARTALDALAAAERRARNAGRPRPAVRLALKADYDAGLLPGLLAAYERGPATLPVEVVLCAHLEQAQFLRDGRADVALLFTPFDDAGLDAEPLLTEDRLVALAADDPLAARDRLRLADLAGRLLPDGTPAERDGGATAGAAVRPGSRVRDLTQLMNLVELGELVWFVPRSVARRHARPGIAYREVTDLAPTTLAVAWPQDARSPAVAALVRAATAAAQAPGTAPAGSR